MSRFYVCPKCERLLKEGADCTFCVSVKADPGCMCEFCLATTYGEYISAFLNSEEIDLNPPDLPRGKGPKDE